MPKVRCRYPHPPTPCGAGPSFSLWEKERLKLRSIKSATRSCKSHKIGIVNAFAFEGRRGLPQIFCAASPVAAGRGQTLGDFIGAEVAAIERALGIGGEGNGANFPLPRFDIDPARTAVDDPQRIESFGRKVDPAVFRRRRHKE